MLDPTTGVNIQLDNGRRKFKMKAQSLEDAMQWKNFFARFVKNGDDYGDPGNDLMDNDALYMGNGPLGYPTGAGLTDKWHADQRGPYEQELEAPVLPPALHRSNSILLFLEKK